MSLQVQSFITTSVQNLSIRDYRIESGWASSHWEFRMEAYSAQAGGKTVEDKYSGEMHVRKFIW